MNEYCEAFGQLPTINQSTKNPVDVLSAKNLAEQFTVVTQIQFFPSCECFPIARGEPSSPRRFSVRLEAAPLVFKKMNWVWQPRCIASGFNGGFSPCAAKSPW
jgi:hypothetical protein